MDLAEVGEKLLGAILAAYKIEQLGMRVDEACVDGTRAEIGLREYIEQKRYICLQFSDCINAVRMNQTLTPRMRNSFSARIIFVVDSSWVRARAITLARRES